MEVKIKLEIGIETSVLAEVVGDVEGAVVVPTILKVYEEHVCLHLLLGRIRKNVPAEHVVV